MTTESMTPADLKAVMGNNNDGWGFGGDGAWWIIILLLFGLGGNRGMVGGCGSPCATQADVRAAVDQQTLVSKLDNAVYGLTDSTYALNNAIMNGFHGVDNAICNLGYNTQTGLNALQHSVDSCCCSTQRAIDGVKYENATNACAIQNTIQNTTRDVIDNANANSRAILDFLTQDKIATLTAENQALKFQASQTTQNSYIGATVDSAVAELIRRLDPRPCPQPAYVVQPPQPVTFPTNCCGTVNYAAGGCGGF